MALRPPGRRCEGGPYEVSLPGWTAQGNAPGGFVEVPRFSGVDRVTLRWGRKLDEREPHERTPELEFSAQIFLDTDVDDPDERARRKLANLGHTAMAMCWNPKRASPRSDRAATMRWRLRGA